MKNNFALVICLLLCMFLFGCKPTTTITNDNAIKYEYFNDMGREPYSLEMFDNTAISYEITPECAAYIAKGVFANIYGEECVNELEITVFDNTETESDIINYGEYYRISVSKKGHTDGDYIIISKLDGRIIKVYRFG